MNILFITRAYPPVIGGMEKFSYKVTTEVSKLTPSIILANKKGKKNLILFFVFALFKSLFLIKKEKIEVIHLGDPVLSPIGFIIKLIYKKPIVVTLHGLDITYPNKLYQKINCSSDHSSPHRAPNTEKRKKNKKQDNLNKRADNAFQIYFLDATFYLYGWAEYTEWKQEKRKNKYLRVGYRFYVGRKQDLIREGCRDNITAYYDC